MLLAFMGISLVPLLCFGYIALNNLKTVSNYLSKSTFILGDVAVKESTSDLEKLGAALIKQKAVDVARQIEIYMNAHPSMTLADLRADKTFHKIAVQSVGETGYTAIVDANRFVIVVHEFPAYEGKDLNGLKTSLPSFWSVVEPSAGGKSSSGTYDWIEPNGSIRQKYAYIAPISAVTADGKRGLTLWATTYINEFSKPVVELKNRFAAATATNNVYLSRKLSAAHGIFIGIFIALLSLSAGVSFLLSKKITNPIRTLAEWAEAVGEGNFESKVEIKTGDELEVLANSFNKMASDLKKFIDEVERTAVEKEALKIKTKFISMVSHELRTPLMVIKEGIGIVLDGSAGEISADQKLFLETAKRNVDRLHRLINEVLDFAKFKSGKMEFKIVENDINATIKEVADAQEIVAQGKGLYLRTELAPDLGKIEFDCDKTIQVLTNLINNALKFTAQGGITITSAKDGHFVRVAVKDTGEGIKEEDIHKVFQEFQQVGAEKYGKSGGTGLGLAISKEIIEAHNGKIWVDSKYGVGTEFIFTLPASGASES
jgi:signal transduction histidine kinase